jgi:ipoprotein LpqH
VKRELVIAVAAATVVAGAAGCSSGNKASGPSSGTSPTASGETKVTIGGQPQNVSGPVVCSTNDGKFSVAVGDMATGIIVGLEPDASAVHNAGLGTVDGVVMSFTEGVPGENASATRSGKTYKITGMASGVDNAGQQVHQPFEIDVTCL